jgi:hypothetical protein
MPPRVIGRVVSIGKQQGGLDSWEKKKPSLQAREPESCREGFHVPRTGFEPVLPP